MRRLVGRWRRARGARPARRSPRAAPARPASTWPRPRSTTTSPSSSSSRTSTRCAPRTTRRSPASPTHCRTSTRPGGGSRSRSRAHAGRRPPVRRTARARSRSSSCCPASTPPRRSCARPRRPSSTAAWRPFSVDGPGQGEAEYDLPIRGDWGPVAEALFDAIGAGARPRPRPARGLGRQPRRLLRAAGRRRARRPGQRLRRAGRPVQLRRVLGRAAGADPRHLPRAIGRRRRRGGPRGRARRSSLEVVGHGSAAPLLIVFGRQDRLIPWQHAERLHDAVRRPTELLMLEDGNHGCANVSPWHRPRTADWLAAPRRRPGDPANTAAARAKAGA